MKSLYETTNEIAEENESLEDSTETSLKDGSAEITVTNTETIVAEDADNKNPDAPAPEDQKENQEEVKKETQRLAKLHKIVII